MSSTEDSMTIASSFLLQSPPGEINDVLSGQSELKASPTLRHAPSGDVRNIIADDAELEKGIAAALEEYNLTQFTTVEVPGHQHQVVICEDGRIDDGHDGSLPRFLDPRSKTSFSFSHAELTVSDPEPASVSEESESFRQVLDTLTYLQDHYHDGVASVFVLSPSSFSLVLVANKYNPSNFWSGRWRSRYVIDLDRGQILGKVLINVHYYEQGNVQLQATHTPSLTLPPPHPTPANSQTATKLLKLIEIQEGEYQTSLANVYHDLGEKTFKGLRRALPMTRSKMDWDKVLGYKLGAELSASNTGRFGSGSS
ncbi:F-actin-capping protein subunit alpha [Tulasnella sp. 427]|nr:F-actin-capping protein subunit alpha [Tulasnella sp. 427]